MSEILRFSLNTSFRNPVEITAPTSNFRGRLHEISKLKNIINNRSSAAILVGGLRGVGKTAFVKEAIREINTENTESKLIVAYISLADVDHDDNSGKKDEKLRDKVLKSLIRALYFSLTPEDRADGDVESLYDKTYFSSLEHTGLLALATAQDVTERQQNTLTQRISFSLSANTIKIIQKGIIAIFGFGGLFEIKNFIESPTLSSALVSIGFLFFSILAAIDLKWESKDTDVTENVTHDQAAVKTEKTQTGIYDLSCDTLEFQFERALKLLSDKGKRVVFVIDELDKLPLNENKDFLIYSVIKPLKNLFNLSKSIFIFVGAEDFYDHLENERIASPYSTKHTLFTDMIFLSSMYHDEVMDLIDGYKEKIEKGDELVYIKFKAYIAWLTRGHVFDVHRLLDSFVVYDQNGQPHVSLFEDDSNKKGNVESDWEMGSSLQLFIATTYDYYGNSHANRFNEKLFLSLREIAQIMFDDYEVIVKNSKYLDALPDEIQEKLKITTDNISLSERVDLSGALEDFLTRLTRIDDFAEYTEEIVPASGNDKAQKTGRYVMSAGDFPDQATIRNRNVQLSFEKDFLVSFYELDALRTSLSDKKRESLFKDSIKQFTNLQRTANRIKNESKNREPKSVIIKLTEECNNQLAVLQSNIFQSIAQDVTNRTNGVTNSISTKDLFAQARTSLPSDLGAFLTFILEYDTDYYVLIGKNNRYVLLMRDGGASFQKKYLEVSSKSRRDSAFRCINIVTDDDANTKKGQMKWLDEVLNRNLSNLNSVTTKIKKQVESALLI